MGSTDEGELGRIFAPGAAGGSDGPPRCGRCDERLDGVDDPVEVVFDGDDGGPPDAWLCSPCYGHLLDEAGVTPLRVFKTGSRRTVVLPLSSVDAESGSD